MSKYIFSIFIFSILLFSSLSAQKKFRPELAASKINPLLLLSGPNQVVRHSEDVFTVEDKRSGLYESERITTLLNDAATASTISVFYDTESKIRNYEAYIYDAKGELIRKIGKEEYKDYPQISSFSLYEDDRVLFAELSHHSYPYTVVWKYSKRIAGIEYALYPNWHPQGYNEAVESASFTINTPKNINYSTKVLNTELEATISELGNNKTSKWELNLLPALSPEDSGPSSYYILPKLLTAPESFVVDNYEGSMESWEAYGAFMYLLFEGKDRLPEDVKAEVRELVVTAANDQEKIDILYKYLQEKMRYVSVQLGIGGWQPFDAAYVAKNSYGDCKALTNYMMALLKEVGIKAHPALIKSGRVSYKIEEDFTNPAFNHVILHVPEEDYWLECTSNSYPPNYIGGGNYNRSVLLITEEGGKLVSTPQQSKEQNIEKVEVTIKVDPSGGAKIEYQSELHGDRHEKFRGIQNQLSEEKKKEWVLNNISIPNFKLEDFKISADKNSPMAYYNYEGNSSKYISTAGKRVFIPLNKVSSYSFVPEKDENRKYNIVRNQDFKEEMLIEIEIPEDWRLESMPASEKSYSCDFGDYSIKTSQVGNKIEVKRAIAFHRHEAGPEAYEEYRKFFRNISRMEKSQAVMTRIIRP